MIKLPDDFDTVLFTSDVMSVALPIVLIIVLIVVYQLISSAIKKL